MSVGNYDWQVVPADEVLTKLRTLIASFSRYIRDYKSAQYDEANTRVDYIDPFFELLGWDVRNVSGKSERYRDVVREDKIRISGKAKAPNYSFRIGGIRTFFVEAKKPSVDIRSDPTAAYQLRRYAYTAKLPLSILTSFEEFAVYDTRIRPRKEDGANVARILYTSFDQLLDSAKELGHESIFSYLLNTFSKEAIEHGSFDRYLERTNTIKGSEPVDSGLLEMLETWRTKLAQNLALRNPQLSESNLNHVVQVLIDRILFLRIAEDRHSEEYGTLRTVVQASEVLPSLANLFERANKKYNSGLFKFDKLTTVVELDAGILRSIVNQLYFPDCPYEFSVMPLNVFGTAYERFLGSKVRLTPKHRAKIEYKPEVRKAGGVYYTPTRIVRQISRGALEYLLTNRRPEDVRELRILDPACGSGSFLVETYRQLLNWYLDEYTRTKKTLRDSLSTDRIFEIGGDYRLTIGEKSRILLAHIYGVDLDPQAVEVARLSLLLQLLEDELVEQRDELFGYSDLHLLPDLSSNVRRGNSVIQSDIYKHVGTDLFDNDSLARLFPFDWDQEFPNIMTAGGFDAVIGNPPWVSLSGRFKNDVYSKEEIQYLTAKFGANTYMPNMYEFFVWRGLQLTRDQGVFSFIVPDRLAENSQFFNLRAEILKNWSIEELRFRTPFPGITADTLVFRFVKTPPDTDYHITIGEFDQPPSWIPLSSISKDSDLRFTGVIDQDVARILEKIDQNKSLTRLSHLFEITSGFGGKVKLMTSHQESDKQIPVLRGRDVTPYAVISNHWFDFRPNNITGRTTDQAKLGAIPKVLLRKTGFPVPAAIDESARYPEQSLYFLFWPRPDVDLHLVVAILNSALFQFYYWHRMITNRNATPQIKKTHLDRFPLPDPEKLDAEARGIVEKIVDLSKRLSELRNSDSSLTDDEVSRQRGIARRMIDQHVCSLYGLSTTEEVMVKSVL